MFFTISLMPFFRKMAIQLNALDVPEPRKVHSQPIPKCGGIAMSVGVLIPAIFWAPGEPLVKAILIGAGIIVVFGLMDDFTDLGYKAKFLGQFAAALIVIFYGGIKITYLGTLLPGDALLPEWVAVLLTLIVIVGVTNAINLSDGLDGLAGGICLFIFICLSYLAYRCGNLFISVMSLAVVGAIFGFLRFNTFPATLFMGDAGSQLLGFLAVTLSLGLTQEHMALCSLLPLILLGFPVLDTFAVMFERISHGRSPFVADKNHFHHKLMRLGLFHTEAVFSIYMIQSLLVTAAFFFRFHSEWFLLVLYLVFSGLVLFMFTVAERKGWKFRRSGFVDKSVKGRLKVLKERFIVIKVSFGIVYIGVPLLLILSCVVPERVPMHVSFISLGLVGLMLLTRFAKKEWTGSVTGICLYLFVPFVVYLSDTDMIYLMNEELTLVYNLFFALMSIFVFLTLKYTRRQQGFEISPMHFLILFIVLVLPNLPDQWIQSQHMGMVAAKIIVLFFSFEVLIGELRGKTDKLWGAVMGAMGVMGIRGLLNF